MSPELEAGLFEAWGLQASGQTVEAERLCRVLVRENPDGVDAWCTLGELLNSARRPDESVQCFERAIALDAGSARALAGLGGALLGANRAEEAEQRLRRAISISPELARAHLNLGSLHMARNEFRQAVRCFRQARRLQPGDAATAIALGWASNKTRETEQAIAAFESVLARNPDDADASYGLAAVLGHLGDAAASATWHRRAFELRPGAAYFGSAWLCALQYDPGISARRLLDAHLEWAMRFANGVALESHDNDRDPERPLVVGYYSRDLYAHPVGRFIEPIFAHHDPSQVRGICYADVQTPDNVTERLRAQCGGWRSIDGASNEEVARLVREDAVDILVDLAGHTANHRLALFAHKPAPVQVTYLGYPGTTGLDAMDYCLVDDVTAPPGAEREFSERLARLGEGFCCFAGYSNADAPSRLPALDKGHVTFGALHKTIKINPAVLDLWAGALRAVPDAKLLIVRTELGPSVESSLRLGFALRGVPSSRLILGRSSSIGNAHLSVYHDFDIALDTVPWCGHATACDGLWMGVPMITMLGARHAGRMTASVLTQVGLEHLIARSPEEFSEIAARLAGDLDALAGLRATLRDRLARSSAGDGAQFTPALEAAYREMWRNWCQSRR